MGTVRSFIVGVARAAAIVVVIIVTLALATAVPQQPWVGECIGVTDGDTIRVMYQGAAVTIRIWGVDAPESGAEYSNRAKQFLSRRVFRKQVRITPKDTDRYQRTVAQVAVAGVDLGQALVKEGLAWHWPRYSNNDSLLAAAEREAKSARLNIWSLPNPIPPWERKQTIGDAAQTAPSAIV
jgi:micrococcal nuclease